MEFHAPDKKQFVVTSESGSGIVRRMALNQLISSEVEAAAGKQHHDSAISPENYSLDLLGEQQVGPHHCFVAQAVPHRKDKYLFEGKLWIDVDDYAVVRIEGHPAKKLSFWIERVEFVRGADSALYGSDAMTGVIQLFTRRGEPVSGSTWMSPCSARSRPSSPAKPTRLWRNAAPRYAPARPCRGWPRLGFIPPRTDTWRYARTRMLSRIASSR